MNIIISQRGSNPRRTSDGFTLVELLLVLVILALIGGLVLPGIIGKAEGAKVKAAGSQINRLAMAVESFYLDTGSTPDSLDALVSESGGVEGWNGPYVKGSSLKDPWGREYVYEYPGEHGDFDIYSLGADGQPGGEGKNADINSWD
ncbi:MAG: type II secretion system major pseudopilin GspG [Xanthomonadales bacterium]|nr:type II secretion system major pseudopilin GspG [Gammaproteobacteria bacterium]MBT8052627.1 type II secretion system major pseudopilin GspG [Gammaproteobacteria bacterium]NND56614.1 type II secretion system major pseudopilin GspG [Xanthomonadales bacterium]NNK52444.1 type II secretion system major pseudopilin GspG [Xanthomonadales bacterium]